MFRKNCVFSHFTATPPSPTSLLDTFKALNAMRVYSLSYRPVILCTTNSRRVLAREGWQTFENSLKKNTIFDEHPVGYAMYSLCISPLKKAKYFNFNSYHSNRFKKRRLCLSKVHAKTIKHFFLHDIFFSGFQGGNRKVISHYRTCNLILEFPRI